LNETDGTVMALQQQHAKEIHAFLESIHACSRCKKQPGVQGANYPDHAEVMEPFHITVGEFTKEKVENDDIFSSKAKYDESTQHHVLLASTIAVVIYRFLVRPHLRERRERAHTLTVFVISRTALLPHVLETSCYLCTCLGTTAA
jgi:hypothetical protein